jgi:hypothetical protein
MKVAGRRKEQTISYNASAGQLKEGALFVEESCRIFRGKAGFFPKGVYHYNSHNEANKHWDESIIKAMKQRNKL